MSWKDILKNEITGEWWPMLKKHLQDDFLKTHLVVAEHMLDTAQELHGQSFEGGKMPLARVHSLMILAGTEKLEEVMRNHSGFMDDLEEAGINIAVIRWEPIVRQWFSNEISATMDRYMDGTIDRYGK